MIVSDSWGIIIDYDESWSIRSHRLGLQSHSIPRISIGPPSSPRFSASPMQRLRSSAGVMWHLGCQPHWPLDEHERPQAPNHDHDAAWCTIGTSQAEVIYTWLGLISLSVAGWATYSLGGAGNSRKLDRFEPAISSGFPVQLRVQ